MDSNKLSKFSVVISICGEQQPLPDAKPEGALAMFHDML
jgi:hypothetical protein